MSPWSFIYDQPTRQHHGKTISFSFIAVSASFSLTTPSTAYPCLVNVMAVGPGFMLTKDEAVQGAADALDIWEEILQEASRHFWLSVTTKTLACE